MAFEPVRAPVAEALGSEVLDARPISGGDISEAFRIRLADGRQLFVKTNAAAPPVMFRREAEGLRWLAETEALRVPEVVAVGDGWLALELIEPGVAAKDHDERLGHGLAALHRFGAERFGWAQENFIGSLPQDNRAEDDWPSFYARRRLEPQLRMAADAGRASDGMKRGMARLFGRLPELVGDPEPPSRLHGDLWGGNCHTGASGDPVLIDPAVYGGHREIDLAMMRLFGGFSSRVFAAYEEAWPLSDGAEARVPLYQLYPLLVHVNLFGGSYVGSVERVLGGLV